MDENTPFKGGFKYILSKTRRYKLNKGRQVRHGDVASLNLLNTETCSELAIRTDLQWQEC